MYGLHHFLPPKTISKKVTHVVKRSFLSAHGSPLAIAAPQRRLRPQVHVAVPDFRGRRGRVAHLLCLQSLRWLKARSVYDKAMVLKRECAGDSPAGLLTAQMAQPHRRGSCFGLRWYCWSGDRVLRAAVGHVLSHPKMVQIPWNALLHRQEESIRGS